MSTRPVAVRPKLSHARPKLILGGLVAFAFALLALLAGPAPAATASTAVDPPARAAVAGEPEPAATEATPVTLTLFYDIECPHCEEEREFLAEIAPRFPSLTIEQHEIRGSPEARDLFVRTMEDLGQKAGPVPVTIIEKRIWIGYREDIRDDILKVIELATSGQTVPEGVYGQAGAACDASGICTVPEEKTVINVPIIGEIDVAHQSLLLSTLVIGFVDGVNPCSLWVISILLAIVIRTGSRRRVLAIGTAFLTVTAGMYALYMVGIYSALSVIGYLKAIQLIVGLVAGVFGLIAIKDYFWFKKGPSMSIPEGQKPGLYRRMREVAASKSLLAALGATTLLAVAVSLIETPCTAGFPIIWTGLLAANNVGPVTSALLFLLYMIPFLLDELIVFGAAVFTMRASKLQEKHGRVLKLVAGVFMVALAGTMLFRPATMESPLGATLVFAGATAAAVAIHQIAKRFPSVASGEPPAAVAKFFETLDAGRARAGRAVKSGAAGLGRQARAGWNRLLDSFDGRPRQWGARGWSAAKRAVTAVRAFFADRVAPAVRLRLGRAKPTPSPERSTAASSTEP